MTYKITATLFDQDKPALHAVCLATLNIVEAAARGAKLDVASSKEDGYEDLEVEGTRDDILHIVQILKDMGIGGLVVDIPHDAPDGDEELFESLGFQVEVEDTDEGAEVY